MEKGDIILINGESLLAPSYRNQCGVMIGKIGFGCILVRIISRGLTHSEIIIEADCVTCV